MMNGKKNLDHFHHLGFLPNFLPKKFLKYKKGKSNIIYQKKIFISLDILIANLRKCKGLLYVISTFCILS